MEVLTRIKNNFILPVTLETLSTFSISDITPFDHADGLAPI